jgi:hypothetical protein
MTIEPYNYNDEPSGRTDTLIQALDKIERLEKQLDIATSALSGMRFQMSVSQCIWLALDALKEIKELEK